MQKQEFIHSSQNLLDLWDFVFQKVEISRAAEGRDFNKNAFLSAVVTDILAWHGYYGEDALAIKVYDVTENGIANCPYPDFTPEEIEWLLRYKEANRPSNQYICTMSFNNQRVTAKTMVNFFAPDKFNLKPEDDWARLCLLAKNVYDSRTYAETLKFYEQRHLHIGMVDGEVRFPPLTDNQKRELNKLYPSYDIVGKWVSFSNNRLYKSVRPYYKDRQAVLESTPKVEPQPQPVSDNSAAAMDRLVEYVETLDAQLKNANETLATIKALLGIS